MWSNSVRELTLEGRDGAKLAAYVAGQAHPAIVLASGLGGPVSAWRHQFRYFCDRFRVVSWDYRGLYRSRQSPSPEQVDVVTQAHDLECTLDALGVGPAVLVGWSMGVQVVLEYQARFPGRASHLVLINGAAGRPFETLPLPGAKRLVPMLLGRALQHHHAGTRLLRGAAQNRAALRVLSALGVRTTELPRPLIEELAREFAGIDLDVYFRTLRALGEHDARHLLEQVNLPTLVIAGARDRFTPPELAQDMTRRLSRSELVVIPRGTHYSATEFPELVNSAIEGFLARHATPPVAIS